MASPSSTISSATCPRGRRRRTGSPTAWLERSAATAATSRACCPRSAGSTPPMSSTRRWTRSGCRSCCSGRASLVRRPVVYTAIGLPERLQRLRDDRARSLYRSALGRAREILAFSRFEADTLGDWLGRAVTFVPFAVDAEWFRPLLEPVIDVDVVTIGADPHRDLELFRGLAERNPALRFRAVATREYAQALASPPPNVEVEQDIPFAEVRDRLASARVVALPVKENSYSGATTVLLQALAMGKPIVVSRTTAIESGYDLVDGENCRRSRPATPTPSGTRWRACSPTTLPPRRWARRPASRPRRSRGGGSATRSGGSSGQRPKLASCCDVLGRPSPSAGGADATARRCGVRRSCSTSRARGARPGGSARRRSRTRSTSGSTRRSSPRRSPS